MKILYVGATLNEFAFWQEELRPIGDEGALYLVDKTFVGMALPNQDRPPGPEDELHEVKLLVTGVGMLETAIVLDRHLRAHTYDVIINAGIAGGFSIKNGQVVQVIEEIVSDFGAQDHDGSFKHASDMGLTTLRMYENPKPLGIAVPTVRGITVNTVHGEANSIWKVSQQFRPQVESMEGAAFFRVCLDYKCAFAEIRAVSNQVEPRNRSSWEIALAVKNLGLSLEAFMKYTTLDNLFLSE